MNWIKAPREVFEEYGKTVDNNFRQLSDGEYINHFETSDPLFVLMDGDKRKTFFTHEAMVAYLEWTEPTEEPTPIEEGGI